MVEEWKDVKGFKGRYQVSNLGRVKGLERKVNTWNGFKTIKETILRQRMVGNYLGVNLYIDSKGKTCKTHQLVAIAFHGHTPNGNKIEVDHNDGDKFNNKSNNLVIRTKRDHVLKTVDKSKCSSKYTGVVFRKSSGKWLSEIFIGKKIHLGSFLTEIEAGMMYKKAVKNMSLFNGDNESFRNFLKQ